MGMNERVETKARGSNEVDVLVIGAGAGGLSAALFASIRGMKTLLCEKTSQIGGTTASSGGIVWAPCNMHARNAGVEDSPDRVREYLAGELGEYFDAELADAFIEGAPKAIETLERQSDVKFSYVPWPDYHPDRPGGATGRTLESKRFDGRLLGNDFRRVRAPLKPLMLFGGLQVDKRKVDDFLNPFRSPQTFWRVIKTFARYAADRLTYPRGTELGAGNALVAALFYSLKRKGVDVWTNAPLVKLIHDGRRVSGAVIERDGAYHTIYARRAVVLATGGFPQNEEMRKEFAKDFPHEFSFGFEESIGEGINAAREIGAKIDTHLASPGYWQPSSSIRGADGVRRPVLYGYLDRGRPGVVAVNSSGRRFVNESNSYHDVGRALIDAGIGRGEKFFFVCDRTFVWNHGLGMIRPFRWSLKPYVDSGYIKTADSIEELATKIGVAPAGLKETIEKHNNYARTGVDLEFGKGSTAYNRMFGHPRARPNPNLAPIVKPPFVALEIIPTTLGTAVGLDVNRNAQVLDGSERPIQGLYACGNDMESVMRGCYPAGGITLGPAITFAYLAMEHASSNAGAEIVPLDNPTHAGARRPAN
ncbi:FAD-dependent oxidoreductase [Sinorhizobium meliloti]|nr:FAD-dependent oxidoreductase [Sinorhizobium meliloti]